MKALNSKEILERLQQGASIEKTNWGIDPIVYIRDINTDFFERVNRAAFYSLRKKGLIKLVKQERLTEVWVIL
jgi:hypothetical protein